MLYTCNQHNVIYQLYLNKEISRQILKVCQRANKKNIIARGPQI